MRLFLFSLVVFAFTLWVITTIISVPIVAYSYSKGKCMWVEPESAGSCNNLPEVYEHVWVK